MTLKLNNFLSKGMQFKSCSKDLKKIDGHCDIFFSYSRKDITRIRWIYDGLMYNGFSVFLDEKIPVADDFEKHLINRIDSCKCLLVVWSESSIASDWVQREVRTALSMNKLVVPVRIDAILPPDEFSTINVADLSKWHGNISNKEWVKTINAIESCAPSKQSMAKKIRYFSTIKRDIEHVEEGQANAILPENTTIIRCNSQEEFESHVNKLIKSKFLPKYIDHDIAELHKLKKFNWIIASVGALMIFPLIIYINIYRRTPEREVVKVVRTS